MQNKIHCNNYQNLYLSNSDLYVAEKSHLSTNFCQLSISFMPALSTVPILLLRFGLENDLIIFNHTKSYLLKELNLSISQLLIYMHIKSQTNTSSNPLPATMTHFHNHSHEATQQQQVTLYGTFHLQREPFSSELTHLMCDYLVLFVVVASVIGKECTRKIVSNMHDVKKIRHNLT